MPYLDHRHIRSEFIALALFGGCLLGLSVYECVWAWNVLLVSNSRIVPAVDVSRFDPAREPTTYPRSETPPASVIARVEPEPRPVPAPFVSAPPLPPSRPAEVALLETPPMPVPRPRREDPGGPFAPSSLYDRFTAVYVLTAHTVYMPNGTRLEAHSGLGELIDDPRHVNEKDSGATPPHLYELTLRETLFHGVQALRLNPVGDGDVFGRDGLLAHTYMLGPKGDSNGCVSFKDYDAFLRAFQEGQIKRLAVVASLN